MFCQVCLPSLEDDLINYRYYSGSSIYFVGFCQYFVGFCQYSGTQSTQQFRTLHMVTLHSVPPVEQYLNLTGIYD